MTPTAARQMSLPQGNVRLRHSETAQRLLGSTEQGARNFAEVDHPGVRMARIAVRPWVGVLDFTTRFPGGGTAEQFAERGR